MIATAARHHDPAFSPYTNPRPGTVAFFVEVLIVVVWAPAAACFLSWIDMLFGGPTTLRTVLVKTLVFMAYEALFELVWIGKLWGITYTHQWQP